MMRTPPPSDINNSLVIRIFVETNSIQVYMSKAQKFLSRGVEALKPEQESALVVGHTAETGGYFTMAGDLTSLTYTLVMAMMESQEMYTAFASALETYNNLMSAEAEDSTVDPAQLDLVEAIEETV